MAVTTPSLNAASAAAEPAAQARPRIEVIDVLRGLVMVVMLLDHVRETFFLHKQVSDPMDVASTEPQLFLARTLAHFCAPIFVFLTGLSAWLYANPPSGASRPLTGFLFKRGALLVLLEVTVITFAWTGQFPPPTIYLQVIWVIGLCMIILSLIHRLPRSVLVAIGFGLVFGHNLLTPIDFRPGEVGYSLWTILHDRGFLVAEGAMKVKVSYPLLPWIGIIVLGYLAGPLYGRDVEPPTRRRSLLRLGAGCLLLLLVLRGLNIYGETLPWKAGEDVVRTAMSFFNYTKYPPSLDFALMTLGVGFLLLAWLEAVRNGATRALAAFGGAPMFFYILHLYVLLALQTVMVAAVGPTHGTRFGIDHFGGIWVIWLVMIVPLYFPVRAFAQFKRGTSQAWVRYF